MPDVFSQHPYRARLEWGRHGARQAAERGDVVVVVDVLSFSTAVATAVYHGGIITPCAGREEAQEIARRVGGVPAVGRREVPAHGRFSLSPLTYIGMEPGTRVVLASPNGATCCRHGRMAPALFVGALVNAAAVAGAVTRMLQATGGCITVVPCGERWDPPGEDGPLRVAVEDLLGAGAILSHLTCDKSPEARACEGAFLSLRGALDEVLWECASGRQLREHGFGEDVRHAAKLDAIGCAPVLRDEAADHDRMMAEFEQFDRELGIRSSAGSPPETVRGLLEQARAALGSPPDP